MRPRVPADCRTTGSHGWPKSRCSEHSAGQFPGSEVTGVKLPQVPGSIGSGLEGRLHYHQALFDRHPVGNPKGYGESPRDAETSFGFFISIAIRRDCCYTASAVPGAISLPLGGGPSGVFVCLVPLPQEQRQLGFGHSLPNQAGSRNINRIHARTGVFANRRSIPIPALFITRRGYQRCVRYLAPDPLLNGDRRAARSHALLVPGSGRPG